MNDQRISSILLKCTCIAVIQYHLDSFLYHSLLSFFLCLIWVIFNLIFLFLQTLVMIPIFPTLPLCPLTLLCYLWTSSQINGSLCINNCCYHISVCRHACMWVYIYMYTYMCMYKYSLLTLFNVEYMYKCLWLTTLNCIIY